MLWAIISDIHGNLEALEAVFAEIRRRGGERIICLGDLVGYGPDPVACVDLVFSFSSTILMGNHDAAAAGVIGTEDFNPSAEAAIRWTVSRLDSKNRARLSSLPMTGWEKDVFLVHASPRCPDRWEYILSPRQIPFQLAAIPERLIFIGHTHCPMVFMSPAAGEDTYVIPPGRLIMEDNCRYIANVGSVGQPRDGDRRASFCLFDDRSGIMEWIRVDYPFEVTQEKMSSAGLPRPLIDRLAIGR